MADNQYILLNELVDHGFVKGFGFLELLTGLLLLGGYPGEFPEQLGGGGGDGPNAGFFSFEDVVVDVHAVGELDDHVDAGHGEEVIVIGGDSENSWINEDVDVKVNGNSIWVSDSEDSTHVKHIRVIELDEDDSGESSIFIEKDGDSKPLMFIDGEQIDDVDLKDMDSDKIETIEVLKGKKAIEKYGEKAKDGVVIIKTKD